MRSDAIRKYMRSGLRMLLLMAGCVTAGAYMHKCQMPEPGDRSTAGEEVRDTVIFTDTAAYHEPEPVASRQTGTVVKFLPVFIRQERDSAAEDISSHAAGCLTGADSVEVEIPITQREYEGEEYHAWISGYEPRMDSIHVFPRHETVTIREPPGKRKRWGIGPAVGFGYTPAGWQPYVGVSVTYDILQF